MIRRYSLLFLHSILPKTTAHVIQASHVRVVQALPANVVQAVKFIYSCASCICKHYVVEQILIRRKLIPLHSFQLNSTNYSGVGKVVKLLYFLFL